MTYKMFYDAQDKVVLLRTPEEADTGVPVGFSRVNPPFTHKEGEDSEGWVGNHTVWHHVRDAMYRLGVTDMEPIKLKYEVHGGVEPPDPVEPAGPKMFEMLAPGKSFTTPIALGNASALVEISILCYDLGEVTMSHGGESLTLMHKETNQEKTLHIMMFHADNLTPESADLVITATGGSDILLMAGRMNDYPSNAVTGDYATWRDRRTGDQTLVKSINEPSQAVGMAASMMLDDTVWAQRLVISPNLYLRNRSQIKIVNPAEPTPAENIRWLKLSENGGTNDWFLANDWYTNTEANGKGGYMAYQFDHKEVGAFIELTIETQQALDSIINIRLFGPFDAPWSNLPKVEIYYPGIHKIRIPTTNIVSALAIGSDGPVDGAAFKRDIKISMGNRMLQTNFVRAREPLQGSRGYSMYYSRDGQYNNCVYGLSEVSPLPINP